MNKVVLVLVTGCFGLSLTHTHTFKCNKIGADEVNRLGDIHSVV